MLKYISVKKRDQGLFLELDQTWISQKFDRREIKKNRKPAGLVETSERGVGRTLSWDSLVLIAHSLHVDWATAVHAKAARIMVAFAATLKPVRQIPSEKSSKFTFSSDPLMPTSFLSSRYVRIRCSWALSHWPFLIPLKWNSWIRAVLEFSFFF